MGWCHEFGPQIAETCEHPMTAHSDHCECTVCGTVCTGRFAGCGAVWQRGPREVAVNAPRLGHEAAAHDPFAPEAASDRWRLLLDPRVPATTEPAAETAGEAAHDEPRPVVSAPIPVAEVAPTYEPPDVTARYALAQLEELNARVADLTDNAASRTEAALEKVSVELERLREIREIDLTEQAAGIFGAVQAGTRALEAFTKTVGEVTDDLRTILADALKSIGGSDGLAAWVAASAADLAETRDDLSASLGRIERDLTLLRRRSQADAKPAKIDDDQVAFIVDAVTEAVLATLDSQGRRRR